MIFALAQRAASEGPGWTRAVGDSLGRPHTERETSQLGESIELCAPATRTSLAVFVVSEASFSGEKELITDGQ